MNLFLTSSPCNDDVPAGCGLPCIFYDRNDFVRNLRACFHPGAFTVIAASPDAHDLNDEMLQTFTGCFAWHGMPFTRSAIVDSRNPDSAAVLIRESSVIMLGGGHVPTQNAFFRRLGLRGLLQGFDGIIMGVSAGSMNCCGTVYAQPELPG